jgi:hypothetical protein
MADRHKEIAAELSQLVSDGEMIRIGIEVLSRPDQVRKDVQKSLEKGGDKRNKSARVKASAGKSGDSPLWRLLKEKDFRGPYQAWYSAALRVVEQLLPDRYDEFRVLYRFEKAPKTLDVTTYTISHYANGTLVPRENIDRDTARAIAMSKIKDQIDILASAEARLGSILADIEGGLQAVLLDNELDAAGELLKAKHLRSAGVVAGVVLERHLKKVVDNHEVKLGRKKPQIGTLNDALKESKVFDNPRWREVQRLGDIRNICAHDDERDPKAEEVQDLIERTEKITKTVF